MPQLDIYTILIDILFWIIILHAFFFFIAITIILVFAILSVAFSLLMYFSYDRENKLANLDNRMKSLGNRYTKYSYMLLKFNKNKKSKIKQKIYIEDKVQITK